MSQPTDPPIVVSGGSVTIKLPGGVFSGLPGGDFTNPLKEIKRVTISGAGIPNYDEPVTDPANVVITIEYGNP